MYAVRHSKLQYDDDAIFFVPALEFNESKHAFYSRKS
jgi:hypothetical protein